MFGGKLEAKKRLEFTQETTGVDTAVQDENCLEIDHKLQQLMYGGPIQRALKADLISLRSEFKKDLAMHKDNAFTSKILNKPGTVFKVFKNTFKRTRFGIVHTRTCPPRCDKEAYIQMIYSATLDIMPHPMPLSESATNPETDDVTRDRLLKGIFAIFVIYTIYETNPLPNVIRRRDHQSKIEDGPESDKYYLSAMAMAMGASYEEGGRRAFRKYYIAPIRITQNQYSIIFRIRDLALATSNSSADLEMSKDCIRVIDRLKKSLQFCEYAGPGSLEGLIGSEQYYHSVALKQKRTFDQNQRQLGAVLDSVESERNCAVLTQAVEISEFKDSFMSDSQHYHEITGNIAMNLAVNERSSRPSRQLQSVHQTLDPLIKMRQYQHHSTSTFAVLVKASLLGEPLDSLNLAEVDPNERKEEVAAISIRALSLQQKAVALPLAHDSICICCQGTISNGLKNGIEKALQQITESALSTQCKKIEKNKTIGRRKHGLQARRDETIAATHEDWLFDDTFDDINNEGCDLYANASYDDDFSVEEESQLQGIGALENLLSQAYKKRVPREKVTRVGGAREVKDFANNHSSNKSDSDDSNDSIDTGVGNLALTALLSSATSKVDLNAALGNRFHAFGSVATSSVPGPGQNALQSLLSRAQEEPMKRKRAPTKKNTTSKAALKNTGVMAAKSHDAHSIATSSVPGPGQNALQSLLSRAQGEPRKRKRAPTKKNITSTKKGTEQQILTSSFPNDTVTKRKESQAENKSSELNILAKKSIVSTTNLLKTVSRTSFLQMKTVNDGSPVVEGDDFCLDADCPLDNAVDDSSFEEESIQTSGPGKDALDKLLSKLH